MCSLSERGIITLLVLRRLREWVFAEFYIGLPLTRVFCAERIFICANCEHQCLAFNETHTKTHTLVRVVEKVEEAKVSAEERQKAIEGQLEHVQGELLRMGQLLAKLYEKVAGGSPSDLLTKGDILDAVKSEPSLGGLPIAKATDNIGGNKGREGSGDEGEDGDGGDKNEDEDEDGGGNGDENGNGDEHGDGDEDEGEESD